MPLPAFQEKPCFSKKEISLYRQRMVANVRWGWFRDIGWNPHIYQIAAHQSSARYRLTCAGRRGGKSEWAGREGSAYMIAGPFRVWIVAPSYELGQREFNVIWDCLHHPANPYSIISQHRNPKAGQLDIKLDNGSECQVISIDKPRKSGHGEEVDLIILSECGLMDNIGGEDGVWNKTLIGAMATRKAEVIFPTTPQGQDEFLYPKFMKGLKPDSISTKYKIFTDDYIDLREYYKTVEEHDPDYYSLQWPSWVNIEGFSEDIQKLYENTPRRIFMEQFGGFFVKWSGSIWLNDFCYDPNTCLVDPFPIPSWWHRLEIIDPGFSGLFAWIAAAVDDEGYVHVIDEYSAQRSLYKTHVDEIIRRRRYLASQFGYVYNPDKYIPVYVDPEDPQCRAELSKLGLKCTAANNDVTAGFQAGASRFKTGHLKIFNTCKDVDRALRNHEWYKGKQEGGKAKEAQDRWKHFSDIIRYLNLAALWPAERPEQPVSDDGVYRDTISNLLESNRAKDDGYLDYDSKQWERLHV